MSALYQSRDAAIAVAEKLKSYAQPQRLMILSHLLEGEHTVSEIDEATQIGQPALSQQLAALRHAGLVETRRVAKQVYYRLADEMVIVCVRSIEAMFQPGAAPVEQAPPPVRRAPPPARPEPSAPVGAACFAKIL